MSGPRKMLTQSMSLTKCAFCGKKATGTNSLQLPSCADHLVVPTATPECPNCDAQMKLMQGKNGGFWRCAQFPTCFGTRNIFKPDEAPDML
ncbi:MAG: hypothetical protein AABW68_02420 [archaeon]